MSRTRRWFLFVAVALWLWPLALPLVDKADSAGYVAVTASLVDDGDLLYLDEYRELGMWERYARPSPTGLVSNHWTLGPGLALAPAYALRQLFAPEQVAPSAAAYAAFQATALFWLLATLLAIRVLLRKLGVFDGNRATMAVYLGSPLVYYAHAQAVRPHLLEALLIALFMVLAVDPTRRTVARAVAMGFLVGGLFLVRPQMAAIALLVAAEHLHAAWDQRRDVRSMLRTELSRGLAFAAPLCLCMWLARKYSRLLYGEISSSFREGLLDVDVDIVASLVSAHHGLFAWSPLLLLSVVGLFSFLRDRPRLAVPIAVFFAIQLYLNGTSFDQAVDAYHHTRHIAGGFSFGSRRYAGCVALFAVGLAALWRSASSSRPRLRLLQAVTVVTVVWSLNLFFYARAHPSILIEPTTWPRLLEIHIEAWRDIPETARWWAARVPSFPVGLVGWFAAAIQTTAVALVWQLWKRTPERRRTHTALGVAATSIFVSVAGWQHLEENTRAAALANAGELHDFRRGAQAQTDTIQREILIEQARLRALFGDDAGSVRRYKAAIELGSSPTLEQEHQAARARAGVAED